MKKNILAVVLVGLMAACGPSTQIVSSWRDPDVVVNTAKLNKCVVAALLKNESTRRQVEDQMASMLPGKAVQSYKIFGVDMLKDNDTSINQKLKADGYDGVVVMRMVKVDKENRYVPGSYPAYYGTWRGYYGYAWTGFYDPGYYTTDKTYYVEVNVYSLTRDKLIWSGITSTMNPNGHGDLFDNVTKTVYQKMKTEGFLL